MLFAMIKLD